MNNTPKITEAIILAGGLGTRLREVIGEYPKPMAPINGTAFLEILFDYLRSQKISKVYLAVGYKWEIIQNKFGNSYKNIAIEYSVEKKPLGTGGAIQKALELVKGTSVFVLNGDTLFAVSLADLAKLHFQKKSTCTIALKELKKSERYGTIKLDKSNKIIGFKEKSLQLNARINGGIYCLKKDALLHLPKNTPFSFETAFLTKEYQSNLFYGQVFTAYFKDIGIKTDYLQFEKDMEDKKVTFTVAKNVSELEIDKSWTLFLDRDGVINERLIDDYVKQLNELKIIEKVPDAIRMFSQLFGRIVVVTNQQGIGRGMMNADDLSIIHGFISEVIKTAGGRIDQFYFAPQLRSENSNYRKPGTGMGLQAQKDFPEIDFTKSLMIGDSESDIEFGMKLGMKTVMLKTGRNHTTKADYIYRTLYQVADQLNYKND